MLTISAPLGVNQALDYHDKEYSRGDYYTEDQVGGRWHGRLAQVMKIIGNPVTREDFAALLEGKHPRTGKVLVPADTATGKHRAAYDLLLSADKSVSLMALVGGDGRLLEAHRKAVHKALDAVEEYTQVRNRERQRETTGRMLVALFEHDTSRNLDPQLHTHCVVMNMSRRSDRQWRALEPWELYRSQKFGTAVYRAEMARELANLGYQVEVRRDGSVGVQGLSREQLDRFSSRRKEIEQYLEDRGLSGAGAAQRAALSTRKAKEKDVDQETLKRAWKEMAADLDLGQRIPLPIHLQDQGGQDAFRALKRTVEHLSERAATFQPRDLETEALKRGLGKLTLDEVRKALVERFEDLGLKWTRRGGGNRLLTTGEALAMERRNLHLVQEGKGQMKPMIERADFSHLPEGKRLSRDQEGVARAILESQDRAMGVQGKAGTGKTFTLEQVREQAEKAGYRVRGFAPTTTATKLLAEAGIESATLASLAVEQPKGKAKELWVVDEAGMLSNRQANTILEKATIQGVRVVFVGDIRQHDAVEAGAPFRVLQRMGMATATLGEIRRQKDPDLLAAVELASEGKARQAMTLLGSQGRVHEVREASPRHQTIAKAFMDAPEASLVIAPSNRERIELNKLIRQERILAGQVGEEGTTVQVQLRKGVTGIEREEAQSYEVGDAVRYRTTSRKLGITRGSVGEVLAVDQERNLIRVRVADPKGTDRVVEYDPSRFKGGDLFRQEARELATGDRVQFREAHKNLKIANGDLGIITAIKGHKAEITLDEGKQGRKIQIDLKRDATLDLAYAVTSHSSQGKTVDRVLLCVDTNHGQVLVNQAMTYVATSRARHDVQIYTDDQERLAMAADREHQQGSALEAMQEPEDREKPQVQDRQGEARRPEPGEESFQDWRKRVEATPQALEAELWKLAVQGGDSLKAYNHAVSEALRGPKGGTEADWRRQFSPEIAAKATLLLEASKRFQKLDQVALPASRPSSPERRLDDWRTVIDPKKAEAGAQRAHGLEAGLKHLEERHKAFQAELRQMGGGQGHSKELLGQWREIDQRVREHAHPPERALKDLEERFREIEARFRGLGLDRR